MNVGTHYLSPEGRATLRTAAAALGAQLAAKSALRETALRLQAENRAEKGGWNGVERRFHTMEDKLNAVAKQFGTDRFIDRRRHSAFGDL